MQKGEAYPESKLLPFCRLSGAIFIRIIVGYGFQGLGQILCLSCQNQAYIGP